LTITMVWSPLALAERASSTMVLVTVSLDSVNEPGASSPARCYLIHTRSQVVG
jgi:hypothetical protein